ncbi:hypothetical protein F5888DRAFT_297765 [Russula emetica]|nr:hypothetical protein F5888DRAFT_297765 [Russula emetica]
MLDSPPPYTPWPSIWTRVLNWVRPRLSVAVKDLRPEAKYVQNTLSAVNDIRFCEKLFDDWMTELDKVMSNSKKPDKRERQLRLYLGPLKEHAGLCSNATNAILQCHVRFASLMAQRIDDVSKSHYNLKFHDSETKRLANDISEASRSLSINVTKMKHDLNSFVSVLEEVQVTVKKQRSLVKRILGWLKSVLKAIARIFATFGPPISAVLLCSPEPSLQMLAFAVSALGKAATILCAADSGAFLEHIILPYKDRSDRLFDAEPQGGNERESLDSVIRFLKETVPMEAQTARETLERFDDALYVMGVERHMRAGRRVTLYGPDPAAVAKEWRDVAKQYRCCLMT